MSQDIYDDDIRDTNTVTKTIDGTEGDEQIVLHYVNGLDADAQIDIAGTHETDGVLADTVGLGTTTVAADGGTDSHTLADPWDVVVVQVTAQSTPTSGSFVAKKHQ